MIDSAFVFDTILDISSDVVVLADSLVSVSMVVDDSKDFKDSWLSVSVFEVSNISSKPDYEYFITGI